MAHPQISPGAATRHDGWTLERQLGFIEALAETGSVARAAAAVGMTASTAYRLRGRAGSEVFAHGWAAAQAMAYFRLREIALDRIEHGVATPSTFRGEVVAHKTVFSDRLLLGMLNHLKPADAPAMMGVPQPADDPGHDHAATIAAFATAIATRRAPVMPATAQRATAAGITEHLRAVIAAHRAGNAPGPGRPHAAARAKQGPRRGRGRRRGAGPAPRGAGEPVVDVTFA